MKSQRGTKRRAIRVAGVKADGPETASPPGKGLIPAPSRPVEVTADRRRFPRYEVQPMYTAVAVRRLDQQHFTIDGHAYDLSEAGIRFELERGIEPGEVVAMQITLPTGLRETGPGRSVFVFARIVWIEDEDEPGPVRMAAAFEGFPRAGDRDRLIRQLGSGRLRLAA